MLVLSVRIPMFPNVLHVLFVCILGSSLTKTIYRSNRDFTNGEPINEEVSVLLLATSEKLLKENLVFCRFAKPKNPLEFFLNSLLAEAIFEIKKSPQAMLGVEPQASSMSSQYTIHYTKLSCESEVCSSSC